MEKGKINKRTTKKNIICLELEKNDGKIVTISERYIRNHEVWKTLADGVYDVEYELMNGKPVKIKIGSTLIDLTQTQQPNKNPNYHQAHSNPDNENSVDTATAPYNFIPLNDVIFTTEPKCIPPFNQYKNNNGYIDLDITALSPIYIRETLTEEEEKKLVELENSNNLAELADFKLSLSGFYKPADAEFRIPGSSLRGMIRTLYEVVTYSKMTFIDENEKLMYRGVKEKKLYQHSIGELRPEKHKSKELDMAEAVFGYIKDNDILPGRVYFEDAICDTPDKILKEQNPKILSSPKPTSFQYYIQQYPKIGNLEKNKINRLKNYDSPNACLAGFKFYWHRDSNDWTANPDDVRKNKTQYTKIQPLDKNSHFKGRIRFTNLSDTELGALLFILNLPEGCAHKIGMAKPLGLGSIRIDAKLNLIDRQKRYTNLKDEGIKEIEDFSPYLQAYYQLLNDNLNIQINDPWTDIERLKQLKCMLDFDHKPSSEKTRYLEIEHLTPNGVKENEYKLRRILQKPCQLVNS